MISEKHSAAARRQGFKTYREKTGIFALTPEQRSENSRKSGSVKKKLSKEVTARVRPIKVQNGLNAVKSGQLLKAAVLGGTATALTGHLDRVRLLANHVRWHLNEGRAPKKYCQYCANPSLWRKSE